MYQTRYGANGCVGPVLRRTQRSRPGDLGGRAFPPASLQQWATRFGARRLASGCILRASVRSGQRESMASAHIVVHYHELWLKRGNRRFFLHKLREALRRSLDGIAINRISRPSDRLIIEIADAANVEEALQRLTRVSGISHLATAHVLRHPSLDEDPLEAVRDAAWEEIRGEQLTTFAVRARRSDKSFPLNAMAVEREIGGYLFDKLQAEGRNVRVDLKAPALTCRIEITRGPLLVYARRMLGPGGLPPNTAGRLVCLLSGGFDSA